MGHRVVVNGFGERIERITGGPEGLAIGSRRHEYRNSSIRSGQSVKSVAVSRSPSAVTRFIRMMRLHSNEAAIEQDCQAQAGGMRLARSDVGFYGTEGAGIS